MFFLRNIILMFALMHLFVLLADGQATAPPASPAPASHAWRKIADLPPGSQLLVRQYDQRAAQPCTLAWIDNSALACDIFVPDAGVRRVVYPIASVASVTQQTGYNRSQPNNHLRAAFIGMGVGGLVAGILASEGGVRAGFAGAALGSLAGGGLAISATNSFNSRPQPLFWFRGPLYAPRLPIGGRHF